METIIFKDAESGVEDELYVLEQTTINGNTYLLVAEDDSEESEAYIFRQVGENGEEFTYEPVEDDDEYESVLKIFENLIEDVEIVYQDN
ncbi:MAG: DUF1292 domain-containing protein [Lachnospiraceae bacterium]|nr:DUF1292 domain-containing protein [Lachnospiraceae bacterium]